jgi:hypothetical protein
MTMCNCRAEMAVLILGRFAGSGVWQCSLGSAWAPRNAPQGLATSASIGAFSAITRFTVQAREPIESPTGIYHRGQAPNPSSLYLR